MQREEVKEQRRIRQLYGGKEWFVSERETLQAFEEVLVWGPAERQQKRVVGALRPQDSERFHW